MVSHWAVPLRTTTNKIMDFTKIIQNYKNNPTIPTLCLLLIAFCIWTLYKRRKEKPTPNYIPSDFVLSDHDALIHEMMGDIPRRVNYEQDVQEMLERPPPVRVIQRNIEMPIVQAPQPGLFQLNEGNKKLLQYVKFL